MNLVDHHNVHGQSTLQIVYLSVTTGIVGYIFRLYKKQQSKGNPTFDSKSLSVRILLHLGASIEDLRGLKILKKFKRRVTSLFGHFIWKYVEDWNKESQRTS